VNCHANVFQNAKMTMKFQTDCTAGTKILQKLLFVRHVIEHLLGQAGEPSFLLTDSSAPERRGSPKIEV
jgi:hypothetical protein